MRRDWRVYLGLGLTAAWLLLGYLYIEFEVGWGGFTSLPAEELGSFLEGAFAPLAFLWLVIGYFLQQEELSQNTAALREQAREIERTTEQAKIQSEKLVESERHARQQAFLGIAQSVNGQLGTIAGLLFISSQSVGNPDGTVTPEEQSVLFATLGTDTQVFSRRLLEVHIVTETDQARFDLFYGSEVRARHTNNFIYTFDRLLRRADAADEAGMISDALRNNAHGLIYRIMCRHQQNAPAHLADHLVTGRDVRV